MWTVGLAGEVERPNCFYVKTGGMRPLTTFARSKIDAKGIVKKIKYDRACKSKEYQHLQTDKVYFVR